MHKHLHQYASQYLPICHNLSFIPKPNNARPILISANARCNPKRRAESKISQDYFLGGAGMLSKGSPSLKLVVGLVWLLMGVTAYSTALEGLTGENLSSLGRLSGGGVTKDKAPR